MDEKEKFLIENAKEFLTKAKEADNDKAYNSAVTLYFKAIAVLVDLFVFRREGRIPSNHAERFRILERKYSTLYRIMDKDFPIYQQSYQLRLGKEYSEVLRKDVEKVIRFTGIEAGL
jgi:HEPN domain-containing protein